MTSSPRKILLVEDNRAEAVLFQDMLLRDAQGQFDLCWTGSLGETLERLAHDRFDAILLDLSLPDAHGLDTITRTCAAVPATPILIITGSTDEHIATEAVRCGAEDYLVKGQTDTRSLVRAIRYAIDRKRMQQERETTVAFLHLVNENTGTRDLIRAATIFLQKQSSCQAVGIRLKEGDDYPYFESRGFSPEFLLVENSLCVRDSTGAVICDSNTYPIHECMCGNVICGRFNPSKPFFTAQGSFWTNNTTELLATSSEADRLAHTRNRCNGEGYESVALIPLHIGAERLGLMQLNDQRKGMFSPEVIALWERLAGYLAGALSKNRAQEALRESKARLDLALWSAQMGAWHWDIDQDRRHFDDQVCHLLGIDPVSFHGTAEEFFTRVHPDDREKLKAGLVQSIEWNVPYELEYRAVWPDGSIHHLCTRGKLVRDAAGLPVRLHGILWDITEHKRSEKALRDSEERLRLTLDAVNEGVWDWNIRTGETVFSQRYYTMLDYEPYQFPQNYDSWRSLVHPDDIDRAEREINEHMASGKGYSLEIRMRTKPGEWRWIQTCGTTVEWDTGGRPVRMVGTHFDITERKQAEFRLGQLNRELRAISECNQILVRAKDEHTLFHDICQIICTVAGYRMAWVGLVEHDEAKTVRPVAWAGEEEGYLATAHITWADDERGQGPTGAAIRIGTTCYIQDCRTDSRFFPWREEALRRGYWSTIALPLVGSEGTALGALMIYAAEADPFTPEEIHLLEELAGDLAFGIESLRNRAERDQHEQERQRLETQLRQAQKMEAIGRLAGGISHDFNNLLTVINGYTDLALADLRPEDPLQPVLTAIQEAGQRAADLTRQLLLFSRKAIMQPRVLNLNELISRIIHILQRIVGEDIRLELALAPDLWLIKIDPSQIEQVLMNLVVNARDAMPRGGDLHIATRNIATTERADVLADSDWVQIMIRDSGVGMDEATQAQIFEPFFTTKGPDKGTGLGLSIVYGIVTQAGGRIEVQSRSGAGTVFLITLPRCQEQLVPAGRETASGKQKVTGETVLLVEDEDQVRLLAHLVLEREGYRVLVSTNGVEALMLCEQHRGQIDLVVTDMVMPNMSGPDLVERLRKRYPTIGVLFMSGYARETLAEYGPIGEDMGYLHKPFLPRELAQAVQEVVSRLKR